MDLLEPSLFIKLAATASVVLVATLIAERVSAFLSAMIAGLPFSAGPAYLFIAMDHDAAFLTQSAQMSVGINTLIAPFLLIALLLIPRLGIIAGLGLALAAWAVGAFVILQASLPVGTAFLLNVVSISGCLFLSRHRLHESIPAAMRRGAMDVVLRVLAVVGVVAAAIIGARLFGARVAGIVALVPIVWISMAVVINARLGGRVCSSVLANGIAPMFGFCLALTAIHMLTLQLGATAALSLALALCAVWNLGLTLTRPFNPIYNGARRLRHQ